MKRVMSIHGLILIFLSLLYSGYSLRAQDKVVRNVIEIGSQSHGASEIDDFLSNRIGGRPVGSHSLEDAEKWVEKQFRSWGLEVMVQEAGEINVGFQRGPWWGRMLSEDGMVLHFGTPTYTSGTKGPQKGKVLIEPQTRAEFNKMKGALKGAWVLVGGSSGFPIDWRPSADQKRAEAVSFNETVAAENAEIERYNREHPDSVRALKDKKDVNVPFYREMVDAGVLGFIQSVKEPMQVLADKPGCFELTMENLPTVCDIKLEAEQYEIIRKKVLARDDFMLEFDIRNHFFEGPVKFHNVIGIIRGTKHPDEYVITGGHLDAYDIATGSVDDGQGVAVTMESARLLALSGAKPDRTIMFAIWTGEEYGLLGSKFFVNSGTVPLEKISNYFNRDGGPLVAASVTVTDAMYDDFCKISKPLETLNPDYPFTVKKRVGEAGPRPTKGGSSDHAWFARNGVPTVSITLEDAKGMNFNYLDIWHTDKDLWYQITPEYLDHSAICNAVLVYGTANLPHLLSREGLYSD